MRRHAGKTRHLIHTFIHPRREKWPLYWRFLWQMCHFYVVTLAGAQRTLQLFIKANQISDQTALVFLQRMNVWAGCVMSNGAVHHSSRPLIGRKNVRKRSHRMLYLLVRQPLDVTFSSFSSQLTSFGSFGQIAGPFAANSGCSVYRSHLVI